MLIGRALFRSSPVLQPHAPSPASERLAYSRSHLNRSHRRPIVCTRSRQLSNHPLRRRQHALIHLVRLVQQTLLALRKQVPVGEVADLLAARLTRGAEVVNGIRGRAGGGAGGEPGVGGASVAGLTLARCQTGRWELARVS